MGRSPCCDKNIGLKKGPWTPDEDMKLVQYVQMHGPGNWRNLPKLAGLQRCGKSCRLRWTNYLRPDIKRGRFSFEEEDTIIQLHSVLGNKWSAIAARLPGRTDNEIKNYWNTHIRKRLLRSGIDPVTHVPRQLDLLHLLSGSGSPHELDLSTLVQLQTLLNSPEALRLALATLLTSSSNQNPNILSSNCQLPYQLQAPVFQPNQFENITNEQIIPLNISNSSLIFRDNDRADQLVQGSVVAAGGIINSAPQSADNIQNSFHGTFEGDMTSDYSSNSISNSLNFSFDSVLSTPSVSDDCNTGVSRDERDGFGSDDELFKFEIPESFDLDEFL